MLQNDPKQRSETIRRFFMASFLAMTVFSFLGPGVEAARRELNLNRSIYVPVRFQSCEHVKNVELSVVGEPYAFALGTRIFQFTYYADKEAVLPEFTEVRIEGDVIKEDGISKIRTNLLVTPEKIVSSRDSLNRGHDEIMKQLRRRRDVRLPATVINIKCHDSCTRTTVSSTAPPATAEEADREQP